MRLELKGGSSYIKSTDSEFIPRMMSRLSPVHSVLFTKLAVIGKLSPCYGPEDAKASSLSAKGDQSG